jgi:hypothetical protein
MQHMLAEKWLRQDEAADCKEERNTASHAMHQLVEGHLANRKPLPAVKNYLSKNMVCESGCNGHETQAVDFRHPSVVGRNAAKVDLVPTDFCSNSEIAEPVLRTLWSPCWVMIKACPVGAGG